MRENFDADGNGLLSLAEREAVTEIDVEREQIHDDSDPGICSLKGVEYFSKLEKLNCHNNSLTSLNVRRNTEYPILIVLRIC